MKAYRRANSDFGNLFRRLCNLFKITKHKTLPLALDLCTYLQDNQYIATIRTSYARLHDVTNALFVIEI